MKRFWVRKTNDCFSRAVAQAVTSGSRILDTCSLQGLKPVVSTEALSVIFVTPTKLTASSPTYDYAGKNKVPELQKFLRKSDGVSIHLTQGLPDQMLYRLPCVGFRRVHLQPHHPLHCFTAQKQTSLAARDWFAFLALNPLNLATTTTTTLFLKEVNNEI